MVDIDAIKRRFESLLPTVDERMRRVIAAAEVSPSITVISVDTKKKELAGDFKNGGRELRLKGDPEQVRVHDFVIPELGRVTPYGVYDVGKNRGWVSVGIDHDTATFAVESIPTMVAFDGQTRLPPSSALADYRRLGRQQRFTGQALEAGVAEVGR